VTPPLSPLEVPSPELPEFEVEAVEPPAPQATDAPTSQDLESATEVAIPSPPVPSALPVDEEPPPGAELVGVVPPPAEPTPEAVPAEPAPIYPASSLSPAVEQAVVPAEAQVESVAPPAEEVPTPAPTITDEGPHPIPETKAPPPAPEIEARPESPRELETVPAPEPPVPPEVRVPAVSPAIEPELSAIPAVSPEVPAMTPPPEPEPPTPPSGIELTIGDSLVSALSGFLESTAAGHHGVCVVRESPERIRARVGSRPIEVFWLTNIGRGPALRPADLEAAWAFLSRKLLGERVTAFFLEGIEYLVRLHGADVVLNGLVQFDRLARENDARIWVYLAPALMKPADLERFRSTFGSGSPPG